jgi:hypothetical protein
MRFPLIKLPVIPVNCPTDLLLKGTRYGASQEFFSATFIAAAPEGGISSAVSIRDASAIF